MNAKGKPERALERGEIVALVVVAVMLAVNVGMTVTEGDRSSRLEPLRTTAFEVKRQIDDLVAARSAGGGAANRPDDLFAHNGGTVALRFGYPSHDRPDGVASLLAGRDVSVSADATIVYPVSGKPRCAVVYRHPAAAGERPLLAQIAEC